MAFLLASCGPASASSETSSSSSEAEDSSSSSSSSTVGTVRQSLFSWFDYESYVGGISELGDGAYKVAGESLTRLIYLVSWGELNFQYGDESLPFEDGIAVSYDAAAGTVSGLGKIVFPADASGKTRVVDVSFEIMDIGTTTVSLPS